MLVDTHARYAPYPQMASLINYSAVFVFLLALVQTVAAEVYYVGPTIGGVVGVVSCRHERLRQTDCLW